MLVFLVLKLDFNLDSRETITVWDSQCEFFPGATWRVLAVAFLCTASFRQMHSRDVFWHSAECISRHSESEFQTMQSCSMESNLIV